MIKMPDLEANVVAMAPYFTPYKPGKDFVPYVPGTVLGEFLRDALRPNPWGEGIIDTTGIQIGKTFLDPDSNYGPTPSGGNGYQEQIVNPNSDAQNNREEMQPQDYSRPYSDFLDAYKPDY
jgi:hypothetical protein